MANNGVSMNIAVFKELNDQLNTVSQGTDIFRSKISDLMGQLQGLSKMVSTMPGQFSNLSNAMAGASVPASVPFNANNVVAGVQNQQSTVPSYVTAPITRPAPENLPLQPNIKINQTGKPAAGNFLANLTAPASPMQQQQIQNIVQNAPVQQPPAPTSLAGIVRQYQHQPRYDDFQKMAGIEKLQKPESIARTSEQIDNLTKGLSSVDKTIAKVLSKELNDLKKEFSDGSDMFKKYNDTLSKYEQAKASGANEDDLAKAAKNLNDAAATIKDSAGKLADASKASEELINESPAAQKKAGAISGITTGLGIAAFAAQATGVVSKASFDFYKDMEAKDVTAARDIATGRGALAQKQAGAFGEQFNLYNARNLMRWGGDMMAPGLMQYSGQEGFGKAKNKALEELTREQKLKEQEARSGVLSGGLETIGNVLKAVVAPTVAGALIGGPVGALAGLALSGTAAASAVISGNATAMNYAASSAQEMTGGKANTLYGKGANWLYGNKDTANIAENTRTRFAVEQALQVQDRGRAYQEAEIDRLPYIEQGVQKFQDTKLARYQAMSGLGAFAGLTGLGLTAESKTNIGKLSNAQEGFYKEAYAKGEAALPVTPDVKAMATPTLRRRPSSPRSIGMELAEGDELKDMADAAAQATAKTKAEAKRVLTEVATQKASEDVKKLADATISNVFTKEMARDDRGNFTNPNMRFANLGLGISEVQQRAYQYQQSLGIGQMKTTEQAVNDRSFNRLNKMSLAGVGSFEQLAGNVTALSQISGGSSSKNEAQLETILAKGVAAGFNNSRLSQSLIQTTSEIASSLNLRNVSGVTTTVLDAARSIGGGKIDERSMRDAASSLQQFAQFTGQKEGPMGMLNMANALKAGLTPGRGLSVAMNMNELQAKDMQQRIQQLGGVDAARKLAETDPSKIPDFEMRYMLRNNPEGLNKFLDTKKQAGLNVFAGSWKAAGQQGTLEEARAKFIKDMDDSKLSKAEKEKRKETFTMQLASATEYAGKLNLTPTLIAETLSETKEGKAADKQKFLSTKRAEQAVEAEKKTQSGFEHVLQDLGKEFAGKGLSAEQYATVLSKGNMSTTIAGKKYTGEELKKELALGDKDFKAEAEKRAASESVSSLTAKRTMSSLDMGAPPTKTTITGIELTAAKTLADAIAKEMKATPSDPTKTTYGTAY